MSCDQISHFKPVGTVLPCLAEIAMRCIRSHMQRANDSRLPPEERAAALLEAQKIAATAKARGILHQVHHVVG